MLPFGSFFILDRVMLTISKERLGTYLNFMLLSFVSLVTTVFINISEGTHTQYISSASVQETLICKGNNEQLIVLSQGTFSRSETGQGLERHLNATFYSWGTSALST